MFRKRRTSGRRSSRFKSALIAFGIFALIGSVGVVIIAEIKLSLLVHGGLGEEFTTTIYSDIFPLTGNRIFSREELHDRLKRLSYTEVSHAPVDPAEVRMTGGVVELYLRDATTPQDTQKARLIQLSQHRKGQWTVHDAEQHSNPPPFLEPEVLGTLSGPQKIDREPVTLEEIPDSVIKSILAAEDHDFYSHHGLSPKSMARAMWWYSRDGTRTITGRSAASK